MTTALREPVTRQGLTDEDWRSSDATTTLPPEARLTEAAMPCHVMRFPFSRGEIVVELPGQPPEWFEPTANALVGLLDLDPGWDSYGGNAIDPDCVRAAIELASTVMRDD